MKINTLQISNILSFKHYQDISNAPKIEFNKDLNILIGQNGAGKSTALEIINFVFRRIFFVPFNINQDYYGKKSSITLDEKRQIVSKINNLRYNNFRLDPNYDFESDNQTIRMEVELDDIDKANLDILRNNKTKLSSLLSLYTTEQVFASEAHQNKYLIDIELNDSGKTFIYSKVEDLGFSYLVNYHLYKEIIDIHNAENESDQIAELSEPFSLIGSYRNYYSFTPTVSLGGGNTAPKQIQNLKTGEHSKSTNASESSEPSIFSLVRLRMAGVCYDLIDTNLNKEECEQKANDQDFVKKINEKIKIVGLKVEIKLIDKSNWVFSFSFVDTKRTKLLLDINSLSAGQKAILHLVFEAYGRGNLKGGLVIIDEPEIHLHYQFQNEYLRIIDKLNEEQGCQYILVTHSESLINSKTINKVKRFTLDEGGYTSIKSPVIQESEKSLIKILDNTRSTQAFFAKKVVLVEGETDRYFFRAAFEELKPELGQEVSVLDIGGKGEYLKWKNFFESFGLKVYFIGDLDATFKFIFTTETAYKLSPQEIVDGFMCTHPELNQKIQEKYSEKIYILKAGDLEYYLDIHNKGLSQTITFCANNLSTYFINMNTKASEIKFIIEQINLL